MDIRYLNSRSVGRLVESTKHVAEVRCHGERSGNPRRWLTKMAMSGNRKGLSLKQEGPESDIAYVRF